MTGLGKKKKNDTSFLHPFILCVAKKEKQKQKTFQFLLCQFPFTSFKN